MCLASSYLQQVQQVVNNLSNSHQQLNELVSKLDREVSVLYHEIEKMDLTPESAYHVCLLLQSTLKKRRIVKDEFTRLRTLGPLLDSMGAQAQKAEKRLNKATAQSEQIRRSLNVTLTYEEIGGITL